MATNYNGFIVLKDNKRQVPTKKQPAKPTTVEGRDKKDNLVQENLKAKTKKIYASSRTVPLKAQIPLRKAAAETTKTARTPPIVRAPVRSKSRTLEPHEIVFLKGHPTADSAPGVSSKNDESDEDSSSYRSDFESDSQSIEDHSQFEENLKGHGNEQYSTPSDIQPSSLSSESNSLTRRKNVQLDVVTSDIFHQDPQEWQFPSVELRKINVKQNSSQTTSHTDAVFVSCQTDSVGTNSIGISVPIDVNESSWEKHEAPRDRQIFEPKIDKLQMFLNKALDTIMTLLPQKRAHREKDDGKVLSKSAITINANKISAKSDVALVYTNPQIPNLLLTIHPESHPSNITQENLICLWNIFYPSEPIKVLSCWNEISCFCMHAKFKNIVIGGSSDGMLLVWELNEKLSNNRSNPLAFHHTPSAVNNSSFTYGNIKNVLPCDKGSNNLQSLKVST